MFDQTKVTEAIQQVVEKQGLAGVSVCVKGPEGTVYEHCFGTRDINRSIPVDRDTVFGIASMSKSICALAVCLLQAEGKLSVDDPVIKYFPQFSVPGNPRDAVTLRHLAQHTSGIPPMETLEWSIAMNSVRHDCEWRREMLTTAPNKMETIEQVIDYVAHNPYKTVGAPGEHMSYSNEGYAILSYVVDQAAGMPLEQYCMERIFKPLGMTRTMLADRVEDALPMAGGNIISLFERDETGEVADDNWSTMPPFRGDATVKSTAPDMAAYYRCLSLNGMHDGKQVLPAAAVEQLIGDEFPTTPYDYYCMGLNKFRRFGHVFCEHAGGLHGIATKGGLLKGEGYGFAVLSNQGDGDMDDILWILYSAVLGLPLDTCFRRFEPVDRPFTQPEMLLGHYTGHEGQVSHVYITLENGVLTGRNSYGASPMRYCGGTKFLVWEDDAPAPRFRLEFLIRDGRAWGVRVGTRIFAREEE